MEQLFIRFLNVSLVLLIFALTNVQMVVHADNITSVLRKYNVGIEQVNTEALEQELIRAISEFTRVESEYRERQSLIHTVELTTRIMQSNMQFNDINTASLNMQRREDYLIALVNVDADLEKIFEAEKLYREAQSHLGMVLDMSGIMAKRIESLGIYNEFLPDTNLHDVEQAANDLRSARNRLTGARNLADIGVTENLQFPINYPTRVSSPFGLRRNPFGGSGTEFHYGLDLSAPAGSEVTSLFNGVVARAGYNDGFGNYVIITHGKELQTLYAHLSVIKINTGDRVNQFDVIGLVGSTGRSTGPHLHLGVYINGQTVDPMRLFTKS